MPHKRRQPRNPKRRVVPSRADSGYCVFGATVLTDLITAFTAEAGGVREGADIEYIHRMRVATRRLRAALPLFRDCYTRAEYRRWLSSVKAITQALGEARDADVQIAFLDKYLLGIPGQTSGTSVSMIRPLNHQRPLEDPVKSEPPAPLALPAPVLRPGLIGAILQVLRRQRSSRSLPASRGSSACSSGFSSGGRPCSRMWSTPSPGLKRAGR